eukprot:TRINITY_DN19331_c0_g1_i2.p3 TRINITY_DN19331_c0_g1~~TRINITY_DN19331_c0_g1_i2.p3  ORF type:complete len:255 (-),score=65.52 TRINITY_DN19331_c0_g1_i2:559-1323(-)
MDFLSNMTKAKMEQQTSSAPAAAAAEGQGQAKRGRANTQGDKRNGSGGSSGGHKNGYSKSDIKAIGKVALEAKITARLLAATVWWTLLIPTATGAVVTDRVIKAGKDYNEMTKGKRGHKKGPPAGYLWAAMVCGCIELVKKKIEEGAGSSAEPLRESLSGELEKLEKHKAETKTVKDLEFTVKHCSHKETYDGEHVIMQYAVSAELEDIVISIHRIMRSILATRPTSGAAPPSASERRVRNLLQRAADEVDMED